MAATAPHPSPTLPEEILAMLPAEVRHMQPEMIRDRWHRYELAGQPFYPSVTTCIGKLDKPALKYWYSGLVADFVVAQMARLDGPFEDENQRNQTLKEVWDILRDRDKLKGVPDMEKEEKADFGTKFHLIAERYGRGEPVKLDQFDEDIQTRGARLLKFFQQHRVKPYLVEFPVMNDTYHYAGTPDLLCGAEFNDGLGYCLTLIDYKTGESGYDVREGKKKQFYPLEHGLQLNALAHGEFYYDTQDQEKRPLPPIERLVVVSAKKETLKAWSWPRDPRLFASFVAGLTHYETEAAKIEPRLIGEVV